MQDLIYKFYTHYETYKMKTRPMFFPYFKYNGYMVPIDENTLEYFIKEMEKVFDSEEEIVKYNPKTVATFKKIIAIISQVNIKEFE